MKQLVGIVGALFGLGLMVLV
ncbi:MAG: hypothetical protein RL367_2644, partial [Pseudomonadota bacterium]